MTKTPLSLLIVRVREQLRKRRVAKQNETPQDKFSRRTANATVLIGVLTIGVILVAIFQYVVFSHQLNVMQGQLDEMRSPHAERAYLFIAHDDTVPATPDEISPGKVYRILFKNYGKTPAVYRGIHTMCSYWPTESPNPKFSAEKWEGSIVIGVNEPIGPFDCPLTASETEIAKAARNEGYIFMIAKIDYDDIFGEPHETGMCVVYKFATKGFGLVSRQNKCNYFK
jgi:hypothetical protein